MYPALNNLLNLIEKHRLSASSDGSMRDDLIEVEFLVGASKWKLFIEDEYKDFNLENRPLCVYLTLRALEDYNELNDFLEWTTYYGISANDSYWQQYYRDLAHTVRDIENIFGQIDPFISQMDYELRAGAFDALIRLVK